MTDTAGFSLLEMLVALALMAIAATLTANLISSNEWRTSPKKVQENVHRLVSGARVRAIAKNMQIDVYVDPANNRIWTINPSASVDLPKKYRIRFEGEEDTQSKGTGRISFYPDGTSSGGKIILIRNQQEWMIVIDWLTGKLQGGSNAMDNQYEK